ncbi:MAG: xylulokinase, partial [Clostridia bacterium]|nr:xylulokinase [Clostridia bacterium]
SGTLLLDVKNKCWSKEMCDICSVKAERLPDLYESYDVVGKVLPECCMPNAVVTAGAGDNAAAAIGTGTVFDGGCNISLGTSGTVFIAKDDFSVDKKNALHSFCHSSGRYHLMGCILSAASANKWWLEDVLRTKDYDNAVIGARLGENDVYFLPYLMGERSPHNDVNVRGAFVGLGAGTAREDMSLAVLEGVAFALRDCVEVAKESGVKVSATNLCGGGAKSKVWREIIANVLNAEVFMAQTEKGPAFGAAILAMVGAGEYASVGQAVKAVVTAEKVAVPNAELVEKYEKRYEFFKKLYPALKGVFN